jgi:starch synthase (maltosyl-transferring)
MASASSPSIGRIPVIAVTPSLEEGRWQAKGVVGEAVPIIATVFREGHDAVGATAVVTGPDGVATTLPMRCVNKGLSEFRALFTPQQQGDYTFRVEGWSDPVATWLHVATTKLHAGQDVALVLADGVAVLERSLTKVERTTVERRALTEAIATLRAESDDPETRFTQAMSPTVRATLTDSPLRDWVTASREYPLRVDRERALVSAWYQMFPRSEGARYNAQQKRWTSGTFETAATRLPAIAAMGFDFVYLTPIHPIGTTFRKGRNNALSAAPGDPGSPYAIGSPEGGHDAVHPELGTMQSFRTFVAQANKVGLEVALDLALQCSPDHPWVTAHPEWFTTRLDGSIAYAENPPKKYQDIYPLNFDNDPEGIFREIRRVVQVWIDAGVTAFRVDNPHTKPLTFWERILADVRRDHPEVIFLSEAFTIPPMMHTLAKIGFHQSYTYFTWRPTADELGAYLVEVSGDASSYMRPNFWPTTHDILTPDMQEGGAPLFQARAVVAATGSPSWGIYSGYEFAECVARPGVEEQIDNEKYEYRPRDWSQAKKLGIAPLLTRLNEIRREHPALQRLRGLGLHYADNPAILCFSRHLEADESPTGVADTVIVVVSLNPSAQQESVIHLNPLHLGLTNVTRVPVVDLLTGKRLAWGPTCRVTLGPKTTMAHVAVMAPAASKGGRRG